MSIVSAIVSVVITFIFFWGFLALTAFLAARFVLGTNLIAPAVVVGAVSGSVVLASASRVPPVIVLFGFAITDAVVIHFTYREPIRRTAMLVVMHFAMSVILGLAIVNLARSFGGLPIGPGG